MLLVADIGNTNITVGVFKGEILVYSWRLGSDKFKTEDEYGIVLNNLIKHRNLDEKIEAAVISSVVLPLTEKIQNAIEKYLEIPVLVLTSKVKSGITIDLEKPKEIGCDRIANACAAFKLYKTPAVVVDFGTATTFDIISNDARFLGGVIAPGIKIAAESLSKSTSLLPKLKIEASKSVIGKNTIDCMLSGIIRGHAAMIDGLILEIENELNSPVTTIATGGYSTIITECLKRPFDYLDEHLTLEGLRIIYNLSRDNLS
ncbi:MAG: type III pantothenate kinase [Candidatus Gastranaerophilales bacterium]|nr:type III pantothenate kinase [Candidatus Gastranaerophilales bacterium]